MDHLRPLLHAGDFGLILPLAAVIAVWLAAARAWSLAAWWSVLFALALCMVGLSKIVYLGWGGGWPALSFKSFSGHATGAMAVYPMLFCVMLPEPHWRGVGLAAGALGAGLLALLLVAVGEHSPAEAAAGCLLGLIACLGSLAIAGLPPGAARVSAVAVPRSRAMRLALGALAFAALASLMGSVPVGWWMIKAARALSGQQQLHSLALE